MIEMLQSGLFLTDGVTRIAVEGQELRRSGSAQHKRPEDIVHLAQVAGVAMGLLMSKALTRQFYMPPPSVWKGHIPKAVMQARLYDELGWGYEMVGKGKPADYAIPCNVPLRFTYLKKTDWKHVGDALLLARWVFEK